MLNVQCSMVNDSTTIRRLRLPLAVCIVLIHLHMQVDGTQIGWGSLTSMDAWRLFACVTINELAAIAVPLFFMISGFLFFNSPSPRDNGQLSIVNGQWSIKAKLRRRVRTLLVPYVLFCVLAVIGLVVNHTMQGHSLGDSLHTFLGNGKWLHNFWDVHTTGTNTNILGITKPISYPILIPLWFIRDLMVIVVMTPLIRWALLRLRVWWIAIMVVLSVTGIWIPLVGFSPSSCLWFSIGAWFSLNGLAMVQGVQEFKRFKGSRKNVQCSMFNVQCSIILALSLLIADILTDGTPADRYVHFAFLLVAVPVTYALFTRMKKKDSPCRRGPFEEIDKEASRSEGVAAKQTGGYDNAQCSMLNVQSLSFFLFAFHTLPLPFLGCRPVEWAKQLLWTGSDNGWVCIVQFVGAAVLTVVVCVLAYVLLQWVCPRFLYLLTGRKG